MCVCMCVALSFCWILKGEPEQALAGLLNFRDNMCTET